MCCIAHFEVFSWNTWKRQWRNFWSVWMGWIWAQGFGFESPNSNSLFGWLKTIKIWIWAKSIMDFKGQIHGFQMTCIARNLGNPPLRSVSKQEILKSKNLKLRHFKSIDSKSKSKSKCPNGTFENFSIQEMCFKDMGIWCSHDSVLTLDLYVFGPYMLPDQDLEE